ncbi:hypothetical protein [Maribacter sp. 2210JD10-5]|uniref:hypothetical protein n=1 Tax=Maribacter sp. 2210JD10-5 TaxID=3386272 RepID=UPI0039BCF4A3
MKQLMLLLLIAGFSCDAAKELPNNEMISESPSESSNAVETTAPDGIKLKISIIEVYDKGKNICGAPQPNVMKVEVIEVLESGFGLTNMPHKKQQLLVSFFKTPKNLVVGKLIEANAQESLCMDASTTFYTINSYKILE